jgi:glyoxylase-like metal-dependent hydrolase (beta-lactamase superfamily II)
VSAPTPLVEPLRIGRLRAHAIQAGGQKLDGGAMFGVVPKPLWERRLAADERNRIPLGMRCLLIEHDDGLVLIDSGAGNKETEKFYGIYGIENAGADGRTALEDGIRAAGFALEDVTVVINTHLHFDHAGGNTYVDRDGQLRPSLPKARYLVQEGEYRYATHLNERTAASYFANNFVPLHESGVLQLVSGEREVLPGVTLVPTPGHVPFHQSVKIDGGGEIAFFLADMAPTQHHVQLPWIMGYDVEPLVTLETKRKIFARALAERWLLIFEHDAHRAAGRLVYDGKNYGLEGEIAAEERGKRKEERGTGKT